MKPKIIGIGEVLWDALPGGERIGGAPANFASHCSALGAKSYVISRVGPGERGERLIEHLASFGVSTVGISRDPEHRTGRVEVEIGEDGQPRFTIVRNVAWDHLEATLVLRMLTASADAVCFGSLGQRSASARDAIRDLVEAAPDRALKVFDVNLRGDFFSAELLDESLRLANVCKLSDVELPVIAGMFGIAGDAREQLEALRERYDLRLIAYTRGCEGSVLLDGRKWCEHPGFETTVRDTIGAGDSFTAAVTMGLLQGWSYEEISETANEIAAFVCSRDGAIPCLPEPLRERFVWGPKVTKTAI